jgi:hypothetical protein
MDGRPWAGRPTLAGDVGAHIPRDQVLLQELYFETADLAAPAPAHGHGMRDER